MGMQKDIDEAVTLVPPEPSAHGRHRAPICDECWPDGWPRNSGSAACAHGEYSRKVPPAERKAVEG